MTTRTSPPVALIGMPKPLAPRASAEAASWDSDQIEQNAKMLVQIFDTAGIQNGTSASIPSTASIASSASSASSGTTVSVPSVPSTASIASTASNSSSQVTTYDLKPGILAQVGESIEYEIYGKCTANTNSKTASVTFGGTVIATTGSLASNGKCFHLRGRVTREATQIQQAFLFGGMANDAVIVPSLTSLTKDETGVLTLGFNLSSDTQAADIAINSIVIKLNKLKTQNRVG